MLYDDDFQLGEETKEIEYYVWLYGKRTKPDQYGIYIEYHGARHIVGKRDALKYC